MLQAHRKSLENSFLFVQPGADYEWEAKPFVVSFVEPLKVRDFIGREATQPGAGLFAI